MFWCYQGSAEKLVKCLESIISIHMHKHNAVTATTFSSRTKSKNAVSTLTQIQSHNNKAPDQIKLRPDPKNPGCGRGC